MDVARAVYIANGTKDVVFKQLLTVPEREREITGKAPPKGVVASRRLELVVASACLLAALAALAAPRAPLGELQQRSGVAETPLAALAPPRAPPGELQQRSGAAETPLEPAAARQPAEKLLLRLRPTGRSPCDALRCCCCRARWRGGLRLR